MPHRKPELFLYPAVLSRECSPHLLAAEAQVGIREDVVPAGRKAPVRKLYNDVKEMRL